MSAAGLADELAALDIGDSVARVLRVPVTRNAGGQRDDFRSNIRARIAKTAARLGKTFSSMTMDKVTDDFMTAVTVVVITRTA